jgi:hypothetical protein
VVINSWSSCPSWLSVCFYFAHGAAALNPSRSNLHWPSPQVLGEKISYERPVPKRHVVTHVVAAFE